ncbi:MAG: hypothetical protein A2Y25_00190 [Candidatus Melainabacteria bacterium GWF2_37_15]|nr:MAG: hypothetical protein A2Y25_00190 [Candidatus Melainabacteria bacterium GWF2_37_15]
MDLVIKNFDNDITIIKPVVSPDRNVESVIAKAKMAILENRSKHTVLDLTDVNFLDCIKIGTIIGTYHFLEFSARKIHILVNNVEIKKAMERLSFNNIEIYSDNKFVLESIA